MIFHIFIKGNFVKKIKTFFLTKLSKINLEQLVRLLNKYRGNNHFFAINCIKNHLCKGMKNNR